MTRDIMAYCFRNSAVNVWNETLAMYSMAKTRGSIVKQCVPKTSKKRKERLKKFPDLKKEENCS
ncbi:hypothetical protein H5410_050470 [Solanum commersonii]|uniref:Uncharacterized protein n=1 Tax=Solanum commersonii TaxID=4109 RepID=A0A9J5WVJ7_SOLCO|nr:hypothetical protein H5410_050470 [Solanum commersonii]